MQFVIRTKLASCNGTALEIEFAIEPTKDKPLGQQVEKAVAYLKSEHLVPEGPQLRNTSDDHTHDLIPSKKPGYLFCKNKLADGSYCKYTVKAKE